jgi:hypothetical protein
VSHSVTSKTGRLRQFPRKRHALGSSVNRGKPPLNTL